LTINIKNANILLNYIDIIILGRFMAFIEFEKSVKKNDWSMNDLHSHSHYEH